MMYIHVYTFNVNVLIQEATYQQNERESLQRKIIQEQINAKKIIEDEISVKKEIDNQLYEEAREIIVPVDGQLYEEMKKIFE